MTSHYLKQWWLDCWRIYASLGLNELSECHKARQGFVDIGSGKGLVSSGSKPLPEPILTKFWYAITRPLKAKWHNIESWMQKKHNSIANALRVTSLLHLAVDILSWIFVVIDTGDGLLPLRHEAITRGYADQFPCPSISTIPIGEVKNSNSIPTQSVLTLRSVGKGLINLGVKSGIFECRGPYASSFRAPGVIGCKRQVIKLYRKRIKANFLISITSPWVNARKTELQCVINGVTFFLH